MIDLNTFMTAGSTFVLEEATAINDAGQIVAQGSDMNTGDVHVFVRSPAAQASFNFTGFFSPIDSPPAKNSAKSGQAVPVKFSLHGNQGLDIFAPGYPASQSLDCATMAAIGAVVQINTAGGSGLQYSAASDQYTYVWKTDSSWSNSCRQLIVKLKAGSQHVANFQFKK
jgi:hypothetical protein